MYHDVERSDIITLSARSGQPMTFGRQANAAALAVWMAAVLLAFGGPLRTAQAGEKVPNAPPESASTTTPPVPLYNPQPPYSLAARKKKLEGTISMRVSIDAEGNVTEAQETSKPLGYGLDESALQTVRTWRFRPARRNGQPVAATLVLAVDFRLDKGQVTYRVGWTAPKPIYKPEPGYTEEARRAGIEGKTTFAIVVDKRGRVKKVKQIGPKLGMGLDKEAIKTIRTWRFSPATRDGKPISVPVRVEVAFHL